MIWAMALGWLCIAGLLRAEVPIDLDSPFLKQVIYQKRVGGYGASPVEKREVLRGKKGDGFYEFVKEDGSLFIVSDSEVLGVLPIFPSVLRPCEKKDVLRAIPFLELAQQKLPEEMEVSASSMGKWKELLNTFEENEREMVIQCDVTNNPSGKIIYKCFVSLFVVVSGFLFFGIVFLFWRKTGFSLICILLGVMGGVLLWCFLQSPEIPETSLDDSQKTKCKEIFWVVSCAKKSGLVQSQVEFTVLVQDWFNYLVSRVRLQSASEGMTHSFLRKPFFQARPGGLQIHQPIQVGPFCLPWLFDAEVTFAAKDERIGKICVTGASLGKIPIPESLAQKWLGSTFLPYEALWQQLSGQGTDEWEIESDGTLKIRVHPIQK